MQYNNVLLINNQVKPISKKNSDTDDESDDIDYFEFLKFNLKKEISNLIQSAKKVLFLPQKDEQIVIQLTEE